MFGLPDKTLALIRAYFDNCREITEVRIFGSRAMGTEKLGSDIDLAILTTAPQDISGHIQAALEDLSTPYIFDVVNYQRITHVSLKNHIDQVGQLFWKRKNFLIDTQSER